MSGLTTAKSPQSRPSSAASRRCSGRIVLLPEADAPFVFMTTGRSWAGSEAVALRPGRAPDVRLDERAHHLGAVIVAGEPERDRREERLVAPQPPVPRPDRRDDSRERAAGGAAQRVVPRLRARGPRADDALLAGPVVSACGRLGLRPARRKKPSSPPGGCARRGAAARELGERLRELRVDQVRQRAPEGLVGGDDVRHVRRDVPREDRLDHAAELDAEILLPRAVGHREVRGHPDQELVHHEPLGPEDHELVDGEPGEVGELVDVVEAGGRVLRPEDGRERRERARDLGVEARVPGVEFGGGRSGGLRASRGAGRAYGMISPPFGWKSWPQ